jgi:hypothetical protein
VFFDNLHLFSNEGLACASVPVGSEQSNRTEKCTHFDELSTANHAHGFDFVLLGVEILHHCDTGKVTDD